MAPATLWLSDAVLELQDLLLHPGFGTQMITMSAEGNPSVIAPPILWSGRTFGHHR